MERTTDNGSLNRSTIQYSIPTNSSLIMSIRFPNIRMVMLSQLMDRRAHTVIGITMASSLKDRSGRVLRGRMLLRSSSKSTLPQICLEKFKLSNLKLKSQLNKIKNRLRVGLNSKTAQRKRIKYLFVVILKMPHGLIARTDQREQLTGALKAKPIWVHTNPQTLAKMSVKSRVLLEEESLHEKECFQI